MVELGSHSKFLRMSLPSPPADTYIVPPQLTVDTAAAALILPRPFFLYGAQLRPLQLRTVLTFKPSSEPAPTAAKNDGPEKFQFLTSITHPFLR